MKTTRRHALSIACATAALIVLTIGRSYGQAGDAVGKFRDSLGILEERKAAAVRTERQNADVVKKCSSILREQDVFGLVAGCSAIDSLSGADQALAALLTGSESDRTKLQTQRDRIDSMRIILIKVDTATAKGRKQGGVLAKQLSKMRSSFDGLASKVADPLRAWLQRRADEAQAAIAMARKEQSMLETEIVDCRWKLEMEQLYVRVERRMTAPVPATPVELGKAYADVIEATEKDRLHAYDSLCAKGKMLAEAMLKKDMAARHRDDMVLVPGGFEMINADSGAVGAGVRVSRVPVLQTDYLLHRIVQGEKGVAFIRILRAGVDRPLEGVPPDSLAPVARWFGGRLVAPGERKYIAASAFRSTEERGTYGALTSYYEVHLDDRYAYLCWDVDASDPAVLRELAVRKDEIQQQRDDAVRGAWRSGAVWNPRRFLVSAGAFGGGYFIQHTDPLSGNTMQLAGAGIATGSLLLGVRYAIEGAEQDGESYGYAGIQCSYVTTVDITPDGKISKVLGMPDNAEVRIKASGVEVVAIATLLRSFYLGVGIGHLKGTIEVTTPTRPGGAMVTRTEDLDVLPSHYVFPIGFMIRAGTNFAFNLGGVVRWRGVFTQPSATLGLGFTIDIPVVRTGP